MRRALLLVAVLLGAALTGLAPPVVRVPLVEAATTVIGVNQTSDESDRVPGDSRCDVSAAAGEQCTLRAAIQEANTTISRDAIAFAIPGAGVHIIRPVSDLPPITGRLTIDGYTQPGASPNTLAVGTNAVLRIELDGRKLGNVGLDIRAPNFAVAGLAINRFFIGIDVRGATASGVLVEGCFVGTNAAGTQALGNDYGVVVDGGASATIGGTSAAARNLISGNRIDGMIVDVGSDPVVQGNLVGTTKSGTLDLGNGRSGILVFSTDNITIGGTSAAEANTIAYNGGDGVQVGSGTFNRILRNSIFANGGEGIDLGDDGRTPNDSLDTDDGPNHLQNSPELTAATRSNGVTTVTGRLRSSPNQAFVLRFFSNPSGNEGQVFRGQLQVVTNANGVSPVFTFTSPKAIPVGQTVTATATSEGGDTSEFSRAVVVAPA